MTWFPENGLTVKELHWDLIQGYKGEFFETLTITFNETDVPLHLFDGMCGDELGKMKKSHEEFYEATKEI